MPPLLSPLGFTRPLPHSLFQVTFGLVRLLTRTGVELEPRSQPPRPQERLQNPPQPGYPSGWAVRSGYSSTATSPALLPRLGLEGEGPGHRKTTFPNGQRGRSFASQSGSDEPGDGTGAPRSSGICSSGQEPGEK